MSLALRACLVHIRHSLFSTNTHFTFYVCTLNSTRVFLCSFSSLLTFAVLLVSSSQYCNPGNKAKTYYSTIDRKKLAEGGAYAAQYDEIPYGDVPPPNFDQAAAAAASAAAAGHSGKGALPQVPSEYAQVPQIPARQGNSSSQQAAASGSSNTTPAAAARRQQQQQL